MKVSYIAINAILISSSASFTSASLRYDAQEISRKDKLDAFTTLMEVNAVQAQCRSKTGCTAVLKNSGYDYCTQMKISARGCGTCNTAAAGGIGMCQGPSVDVNEEFYIVNSMKLEELIGIAAEVVNGGGNPPQEEFDESDFVARQGALGRATSTASRATSNAASTASRATGNAASTADRATKQASRTAWGAATGGHPQEDFFDESSFVARDPLERATSTAGRATSNAASTASRATSNAASAESRATGNAASTADRATKQASHTAWGAATGGHPQGETDETKVSYLRASRK